MKKTILALQNLLPDEMHALEQSYDVIKIWKQRDPEATLKEQKNNVVGIVSTYNSAGVSKKLMAALPNLEIIAQYGVGVNNIDLEAAQDSEIAVTYTPDILTNDTADIAMSLLLSVTRRIVEGDMFVRVGRWQRGALPLGTCLSQKTAGIVGLGRIGKAIAKRLQAFDIDIVYHGRNKQPDVQYTYYEDLQTMAADVDFLILACSGGPNTQHLITLDVLKKLGPQGFIINIARGSVINEEDLLIALRNKDIAGAGLDVFENEPLVPQELIKMDNVVLLPHIGSATLETRTKMGQLVIDNLEAYFSGKPLITPVK